MNSFKRWLRNYKIVKNNSGKYAIRKGRLRYKYKDLRDGYWWSIGSEHINDCWGSAEKVLKVWEDMREDFEETGEGRLRMEANGTPLGFPECKSPRGSQENSQ